jgi:hypothetical protein
MTIRYTTDIFCDQCANWLHGTISEQPKGQECLDMARELGWTRKVIRGRKVDLCPECSDKMERASKH